MPTVHIIANPVAGGGKGIVQANALLSALEERDVTVQLFCTEKAGDARAEAAVATADIIAVVGGDGTLNEVLNGLPEGTYTALAILPVGTANVVARELGMAPDAQYVADRIVAGEVVAMDVGLHEAQRFLLGAGAGLDAAVAHAVHLGRGKKSSLIRWVLPALRVVWQYDYPKIRVVVDGAEVASDAEYVIIGNCRYSAGVFPATPHAEIGDHRLDICVMRKLTWARLLWLMVRVWRPDFIKASWIDYRQGQEICLTPATPGDSVLMQIDGDPAGHIPATFSVAEWSVRMIHPRGQRVDHHP